MFNEPPNELRNIQREIDRVVDAMIALLPREEQTEIIRKEAERRKPGSRPQYSTRKEQR